jgi:ABC-type glycerol-3-phosphate transport system substrate-binding protein
MSSRKRWRILLALAAVVALVASACGGGEEEGAEFEAEDLSGQTIEVMAKWTEGTAEQGPFLEVLKAFEDATGATVTYTPAGDEIPTVLGTRVEGGDPPDVAILPQPGVFKDFADRGALLPLEDIVGASLDANFEPVWRELGTVDGTLYGVWFKAANKSTFWYNVNVFNDAGVEPPATWDDLQTVAQTIKDFGLPPYGMDGASGWTLSDWFENIYIRVAGADMYDQLAKHEIPWTDQSVKDSLTLFADVVGDDANLLGGVEGTLQSEFPAAVALTFGDPPQAAMYYEADFLPSPIMEAGAQVGVDADFFDFPSIEGSGASVVAGGDVAVMLKDSAAARALIEFLASSDAGEVWAALGGFTSPNKSVDLAVYPDDVSRRSAEILANAEAVRFDLSDQEPGEFGATAGQGIWGLLQEFVRNPDVDDISQRLEDAAAAAFA